MSSDNREIVTKEEEFITTRSFETGNSTGRKNALNSISSSEKKKPLKSCQEIADCVGLSFGTSSEITTDKGSEVLKCPDISIYETDGPLKIYIEGSKKEGFCGNDISSENSILPDIGNLK